MAERLIVSRRDAVKAFAAAFVLGLTECMPIKQEAVAASSRQAQSTSEAQAFALRDGYWRWYTTTGDPLDACTLGVVGACRNLPDLSPDAWAARVSYARETLTRIHGLPLEHLPPEIGKDIESIRRLALYTVHQGEREFELFNLAWSDWPPTMLLLQSGQARDPADWGSLAARLEEYPRMLRQHEANLRAGRARGFAPDHDETLWLATTRIPEDAVPILRKVLPDRVRDAHVPHALASRLERAAAQAATALESHSRFLKGFIAGKDFLKQWRPDGEQEAGWRLRELHGVTDAPRAVFDQAVEWVRQEQARFVELALRLDPTIRSFSEAVGRLHKLPGKAPTTGPEAISLYEQLVLRLTDSCRKVGIPVPPDFNVKVEEAPLGFWRIAEGSNIPPSLLRRRDLPLFVVSVEPEILKAHTPTHALQLSKHEAVPGHGLVAAWWQNLYGGHQAPIAWAHQHDVSNELSGAWLTMTYVEAWALIAESLLEPATPEEALATQFGRLLRAVRVRVDLGLHAGFLSRDEAAAELAAGVGMPDYNARTQIRERYGRQTHHGQAYSYYLGLRQIERLRQNWIDQHPETGANDFYREFFRQPPLPPNVLRRWMLKQ
jgi:uncharacterized protein (DUF885 family)